MANIKSKRESQFQRSRSRLFEEIILKSWWTILFFLLSYFAYDQAIHHKMRVESNLRKKLEALAFEKERALEKQEDLKLQIASQGDDGFIELVLMRRLGLVPEGQKKVHFITVP